MNLKVARPFRPDPWVGLHRDLAVCPQCAGASVKFELVDCVFVAGMWDQETTGGTDFPDAMGFRTGGHSPNRHRGQAIVRLRGMDRDTSGPVIGGQEPFTLAVQVQITGVGVQLNRLHRIRRGPVFSRQLPCRQLAGAPKAPKQSRTVPGLDQGTGTGGLGRQAGPRSRRPSSGT